MGPFNAAYSSHDMIRNVLLLIILHIKSGFILVGVPVMDNVKKLELQNFQNFGKFAPRRLGAAKMPIFFIYMQQETTRVV